MNQIELVTMLQQILDRIPSDEVKGVFRLRLNVHARNLEARSMIAHSGTSAATEQIEHPHRSPPISTRTTTQMTNTTSVTLHGSGPRFAAADLGGDSSFMAQSKIAALLASWHRFPETFRLLKDEVPDAVFIPHEAASELGVAQAKADLAGRESPQWFRLVDTEDGM
jgi:hypothetical protein